MALRHVALLPLALVVQAAPAPAQGLGGVPVEDPYAGLTIRLDPPPPRAASPDRADPGYQPRARRRFGGDWDDWGRDEFQEWRRERAEYGREATKLGAERARELDKAEAEYARERRAAERELAIALIEGKPRAETLAKHRERLDEIEEKFAEKLNELEDKFRQKLRERRERRRD